jgi:hypothetical protein
MDAADVFAGFAALDETELSRPWSWRGATVDVRYALYRALEEAQEASVLAAAEPHAESRRILACAQRAFGDLQGLLTGVPVALLEQAPRPGEWSIHEVVAHLVAVEQRYALHTFYAVERADADPVRLPDSRLPPLTPSGESTSVAAALERLAAARAETNRQLGKVAAAAMTRPTIWAGANVDVRFRLHRFASHLVEHGVQCEKLLAGLGWRPPEGGRIVRRLRADLGYLEGLAPAAEVRAIEARLVERYGALPRG